MSYFYSPSRNAFYNRELNLIITMLSMRGRMTVLR